MSEKHLGKLTVREFFARFPDDDACLTHVMEVRYGLRHICRKCGVEGTFHKLSDRRAFSCSSCGDHVYPCAGTIFQDSRTPLQVWFYAIYLFVTTRHGVSGKELERTLGVTYKTAWRMGQQIRLLMAKADKFEVMQGHIEMDETLVGGVRPGKRGRGAAGKTIVFGMTERGGRTWAKPIADVKMDTIRAEVVGKIKPGSIVSTDEHHSYGLLWKEGLRHGQVRHRGKEYARFDKRAGTTHHTNTIEGFWRLFKDSIRSTHIHVSSKYMDRYVNEFTFRSNHRAMQNAVLAPYAPKGTSRISKRGQDGECPMRLVEKELDRIGSVLRQANPVAQYGQLYAAQQALLWVLDPETYNAPYDMLMQVSDDTHQGSADCQEESDHSPSSGNLGHRASEPSPRLTSEAR